MFNDWVNNFPEYIPFLINYADFGSWFEIPVLAIIIQSIIFAALHSYNAVCVITIFISGIVFGMLARSTNGLEAGSSIHSINNLLSFYIVALGFESMLSLVSVFDVVMVVIITVISELAVYWL